MGDFDGPALIVWETADRAFKPELGRRLAGALREPRYVEVPEAKTFVMLDATDRLAAEILDSFYTTVASPGLAQEAVDHQPRP